jgi:hypothetical protein
LKIKLKAHNFYTIEVIGAGSQVVLNTFTEHNFQDLLKKMAKALERVRTPGKDYFEGDGGH